MPPELDNLDPGMDAGAEPGMDAGAEPGMDADMGADPGAEGPHGDQEGAMAKQELIKLANYATNLQEHIQDDEELEAWVQSKITIAATNIASVYHYLAYEKKIGEYGEQMNSPALSESKKRILKNWLMEAKSKVKALKKADAEKVKMMEGPLNGGEQPCGECGGTGVVHMPGMTPHPKALAKVEKYKRLVKATKAAHKRMDGQDSPETEVDEEVENAFSSKGKGEMKVGDTKKTRTGELTKTNTGVVHKNTSYADDGEADQKSGKGIKTHAKAKDAETKKAERGNDIKLPKHNTPTWGKKNGEKFDNRKEEPVKEVYGQGVYEAKKKKPDFLDMDKDGNKKESMKKAIADKKSVKESKMPAGHMAHHHACEYAKHHKAGNLELAMHHKDACESCGGSIMHGAMGETYHQHPHLNQGTMYECDPNAIATPMAEGKKPSAGLSKAKKSATVKKAKAGGDIGKPGKGFDKLAKKAGGGEKGEKIAAAAMWKNIKETTAYMAEKKAELAKKDYDGDGKVESGKDEHAGSVDKAIKKAMDKKETVKESSEVDRLVQLTGRLNRTEKPALVENREVDQIRALTKRLLG